MALPGEFEYYSSRSGLPAGTLDDHKLAYFRGQLGVSTGALPNVEYDFYGAQGATGALDDRRLSYYQTMAAAVYGAGTVTDCQLAFFAMANQPLTTPALTTNLPPGSVAPASVATFSVGFAGWPNPASLTLFRRVNAGAFAAVRMLPAEPDKFMTFAPVTLSGVATDVIDFEVRGNGGAVVSNRVTYTLV